VRGIPECATPLMAAPDRTTSLDATERRDHRLVRYASGAHRRPHHERRDVGKTVFALLKARTIVRDKNWRSASATGTDSVNMT
jgi:hypothetical protein